MSYHEPHHNEKVLNVSAHIFLFEIIQNLWQYFWDVLESVNVTFKKIIELLKTP